MHISLSLSLPPPNPAPPHCNIQSTKTQNALRKPQNTKHKAQSTKHKTQNDVNFLTMNYALLCRLQVLEDLSASAVALIIPNGAHHIDLMFTDPADSNYPDIVAARNTERQHMKAWVTETYARYGVEGLVPDVPDLPNST
jgi:hypothetical protein